MATNDKFPLHRGIMFRTDIIVLHLENSSGGVGGAKLRFQELRWGNTRSKGGGRAIICPR